MGECMYGTLILVHERLFCVAIGNRSLVCMPFLLLQFFSLVLLIDPSACGVLLMDAF
jgi:hypothetical protein